MPATTVATLQAALATPSASNTATYFIEPGVTFVTALNEVGPKVYAMGMWRDLLAEQTYDGSDGYISLDRDIESILDANVNDLPSRVRSQFHDRAFWNARDTKLPSAFGLVDMGYYARRRDFKDIQEVDTDDDVTPVTVLYLTDTNGVAITESSLSTTYLNVIGSDADGLRYTATLGGGATATLTFATGVNFIDDIVAANLPSDIELRTDAADSATNVATLSAPSDVVRYRRYRVAYPLDNTYVHILAKRGWKNVALTTDVVYLGNLMVWKHALLAKVAEDNADVERAQYHWAACRGVLEDEREAQRGGAKPALRVDLSGGAAFPIHNLM